MSPSNAQHKSAFKQNDKIIETGNRLQSLFSDGFVQILRTQEEPTNAYGISICGLFKNPFCAVFVQKNTVSSVWVSCFIHSHFG